MRIHTIALLALGFWGIPSPASAALLIQIDKSAQTLTVIRDGENLAIWPVSTGRGEHPTPSGSFTAFRMEADHYSKEWDDAPMPHSIFFTKQGHAIHGSFEVKRLGSPASHGCVRLAPENAAVLFALVTEEGLPNTKVVLTGSEQVALARINAQRGAQQTVRGARGGQANQAISRIPAGLFRHRPVTAKRLPAGLCSAAVCATAALRLPVSGIQRVRLCGAISEGAIRAGILPSRVLFQLRGTRLPPGHRH